MIDALMKSIPHGTEVEPGDVRSLGWNLLADDLHFPLLVLRESALESNIRRMAAWCAANGFLLAPHGKTTMCPRIFKRQIEAGAWGITVAHVSQAEVCARFGIDRVLIANQVVGPAHVRSLARLMADTPRLDAYCLIDSVAGVRHLAQHLADAPRPVGVLLEWGRRDWRTGARSLAQAREVAEEALRHERSVRLCGIEAFEGIASEAGDVETFLCELAECAESLKALIPGSPALLSAGGSAYLDEIRRFARQAPDGYRVVVRSGCYVTHDHGIYAERYSAARSRSPEPDSVPELRPALELWGYVQSRPQENLALLTFGKRDCPYDAGLPVPLFSTPAGARAPRIPVPGRIVKTNDQHGFLELDGASELAVGDRVCCGISHPCTAFDKWRVIPVVDDDYNVTDLYETYF